MTHPDSATLPVQAYARTLGDLIAQVAASDRTGPVDAGAGLGQMLTTVRDSVAAGNRLMFVGNGGSAAIASHMAIDYSKNGRLRATAFNDPAALTCLSNDLGYENVFAHQIECHARAGDVLIAISSSGRSANILRAVDAARARDCRVITLSGFSPDNPLRQTGDLNFYIASDQYGFVEIGHLAVCHLVLDVATGWQAAVDR